GEPVLHSHSFLQRKLASHVTLVTLSPTYLVVHKLPPTLSLSWYSSPIQSTPIRLPSPACACERTLLGISLRKQWKFLSHSALCRTPRTGLKSECSATNTAIVP